MAKKYYAYTPSEEAAIAFVVLYLLSTIFHAFQMVRCKTWYFTAFVIGGIFEVFGYAARALNAKQAPDYSRGLYILQSLGILLAPAFFTASIYMEFGRIILMVDGERLAVIKKRWLTKIFVAGDVLSFLMQAGGGAILAGENASTANTGKLIINLGLGVQIVFFAFFLSNIYIFWRRLDHSPNTRSLSMPWKKHAQVLLLAGLVVMVRCIFRLIEYLQGKEGTLQSSEVYLYIFDATLMLIVMLIFHVWHPSEVGSMLSGGKVAKGFRIVEIGKWEESSGEFTTRESNVELGSMEMVTNRK